MHPKHLFKLMGKEIMTILRSNFLLNWIYKLFVPQPQGEDVVVAERVVSLCSACDLSAKHLYVLPQTDHLIGYTITQSGRFFSIVSGQHISVYNVFENYFFLFLNQNICCGYSKEPSQ